MKSYQITIQGRVQNVGFRHHTEAQANKLDITGFVQNLPNGNVYIEAEGEEPQLSQFIAWCHMGPAAAKVFKIHFTEQPLCNYRLFYIKNQYL